MTFKKTLIASAIATAAVLSSGSVMADVAEYGEGFVDGASMELGFMYYGRQRNAKGDTYTNQLGKSAENDNRDIKVHALGMSTDLKSGWYDGWFAVDGAVFANVDLLGGNGYGWSEVLFHNNANANAGGTVSEENSSSRIGRLRAHMRFGDERMGLNVKAGITDINAGTIGTSGGLNAHAYRGVEAKGHYDNFTVTYGIADRFMNDWDDSLEKITNHGDQYREGDAQVLPSSGAAELDYIHSIGGRYGIDNGWVDVAYGEGKGYRKNYHLAGSYGFALDGETRLRLTSYYQSGKYKGKLGSDNFFNGKSAHRESTWSSSAVVSNGGWNFVGGYGQTDAPDGGGVYQLRLTPWGNADHRNFMQTASVLDDFLWDGQKVVRVGADYTFSNQGLPGLTLGANAFYSWDGYNNRGTSVENRDAKMKALDFEITYRFQSEPLRGLWIGIFPSFLRVSDTARVDNTVDPAAKNAIDKSKRNDLKLMATYNISVF